MQDLNLRVREIKDSKEKFTYYLSNNMKVVCEQKDVINYLKSMISSLFQDKIFRRILVGLAGRNIRLGLEVFLEFCKSGHISEDEILKIRHSDGSYKIPSHLLYRTLFKRKRLYYDDQHSYIKNLFASYSEDTLPNPFIRLYILYWLKEKFREYGSNNTRGYHKASELIKSLQTNGHSFSRIMIELEKLSKAECISSESLEHTIKEDDLISISPTGFIHLDLLRNLNYLSTVAEDTYFREHQIATKIKENMLGEGPHFIYSKESSISSSKLFIDYMVEYHDKFFPNSINILSEFKEQNILISLKDFLDRRMKNDTDIIQIESLFDNYPSGTIVDGQITSINNVGLSVEFALEGFGFIHISKLNILPAEYLGGFEVGDWVKVEVIKYNKKYQNLSLRLIDCN